MEGQPIPKLSIPFFLAVRATAADTPAPAGDVEQVLKDTAAAAWEQTPAVGEGEEYRAEFGTAHGSALTHEGRLVHLSVLLGR